MKDKNDQYTVDWIDQLEENTKEPELLHNSIKCPDGTVLVSRFHHNFVSHVQEDGREYAVDGGLSYSRILHSDNEYENLCVYDTDPHDLIRNKFEWTRNYDADMNLLPKPERLALKDITDDHLKALVDYTVTDYPAKINKVFVDELKFRGL